MAEQHGGRHAHEAAADDEDGYFPLRHRRILQAAGPRREPPERYDSYANPNGRPAGGLAREAARGVISCRVTSGRVSTAHPIPLADGTLPGAFTMNTSETYKPVSLAAGGLLLRDAGGRYEIALVHRPQYDDWTLPKGKLEPGETVETAALREVREETGFEPELGEFVDVVRYETDTVHKVVLFWRMSPTPDPPRPLAADVDECRWVPLDRAPSLLTHRLEGELLARLVRDHQP
jgi:8-oxo-dGTP pyrophosphatase MutT (NUDIX family)